MSKLKIINDIKTLLKMEVKLEAMKLDNGTVLEAEAFEPNQEVFIVNEDERVPLPIGEYVLEDGRALLIVEEGIISEIKEQEAPAEEPSEAPVEEEMEAEPAAPSPKKVVKSISEEMFFAEIEKLRNEIAELKLAKEEPKEVEEVEVELTEDVKPIVVNPEAKLDKKEVNLYSQKKNKSVQSTVWAKIANIK